MEMPVIASSPPVVPPGLFMGTLRELTTRGAFLSSHRNLCSYRADRAVLSQDGKSNATGFPVNFSGSQTEESWAPLPTSSVCWIQRIVAMARNFPYGLMASWPALTHFPPRTNKSCPIPTLSLSLPPF